MRVPFLQMAANGSDNISSYQDMLIFNLPTSSVSISLAGMKLDLESLLGQRIVVLDGAMGTLIQAHRLDEAGFRGDRFKDWKHDLKGNYDVLNLTRPQIIQAVHRDYLEAGADIIETNTFNSTAISMADYKLEDLAYELNLAGARNARAAADAFMGANSGRICFVAGALGL